MKPVTGSQSRQEARQTIPAGTIIGASGLQH
jgi:hypothetical protein